MRSNVVHPEPLMKKRVYDLAAQEASRHMSSRNFKAAIGASLCALKLGTELSENLMALYFQLSEANLGLGKLQIAKDFLQLAQANFAGRHDGGPKQDQITDGLAMEISLNRILGKIELAQGNQREAIRALAQSVYLAGELYGTCSFETGSNLAALAEGFGSVGDPKKARHCYRKILEIASVWTNPLSELQQQEFKSILSSEYCTELKIPDHLVGDSSAN